MEGAGGPAQPKVLKNKSRRLKSRDESAQAYVQSYNATSNNMAYQISFSDEMSVAPSQQTENNNR
jgi:hypothetical protein